jgi:molybdenum cofactor biosynthesis protein MoaC
MRDVSNKPNTLRTAKATSLLHCLPETIAAIRSGNVPKADPLGVAKVAAIQAAKNTSMLIPYCHQVPLDFVGVEVELRDASVHFFTEVKAVWKTGVEMEALVAASTAALTLYDMLKAIDDTMEIGSISLLKKEGGKSDFPKGTVSQVRAGVLVLSDMASKGQRQELSGNAIKERLEAMGIAVMDCTILPDEQNLIEENLVRLCDKLGLDIVLTTGGTGLGPRDVTPEATRNVIQRELPGVEEFLRSYGQERTRYAMLGRGVAGVRGKTVIVNLPGSVGGVNDSLDILFPWLLHSLEMIKGGGH